mgnify:CR=1 FL=1
MTATELYEIVKDHRDVWEDAIVLCRDGDEQYYWASMLQDYGSECGCDTAEAALLGLGVKWLVERKAHPGTGYPIGKDGSFSCWVDPKVGCDFWDRRECRGPSILAAIYAAISEVKRETKDPH